MDRKFPPPENKPSTSFSSERVESAVDNRDFQKADEEYRVGPGRPPKQYRWQKGQSGNPAGEKRKRATSRPRPEGHAQQSAQRTSDFAQRKARRDDNESSGRDRPTCHAIRRR